MAKIQLDPDELDHLLGADTAPLGIPPIGPLANAPIIPRAVPAQPVPSITGMNFGAPKLPPRSITDNPLGPMNPATPLERPLPAADRLATLEQRGPGINRFSQRHHILGPIVKGLETVGTVLSPGAMSAIPGTRMNYRANVLEAENEANQEASQAEKAAATKAQEADTAERNALAEQAEARTEAIRNPPKKEAKPQHVIINDPQNPGNPKLADFVDGVYQDPDTGKVIPGARPYEKPPVEGRPIAGSVNNKPAWGLFDPKAGWVDPQTHRPLPGFQPPPSWAEVMPGTHTTQLIDPTTGLPTTFQYNPQTGSFDKVAGISATGAYGHEMAQAGAVTRGGDQLIADIEANKDRLGTLEAWVKKYGLNTPIADPQLAGLQAELSTFSALQPAMHGFRSRSAMETFDKIIGGLQKNPDATIASIRGILKTAGAINPALEHPEGTQAGTSGGAAKEHGTPPKTAEDFLKKYGKPQ